MLPKLKYKQSKDYRIYFYNRTKSRVQALLNTTFKPRYSLLSESSDYVAKKTTVCVIVILYPQTSQKWFTMKHLLKFKNLQHTCSVKNTF